MTEADWLRLNRANWDERVPIHLRAPLHYDLATLRNGEANLDPVAGSVLGNPAENKILHLQCHFGRDSLILAQRGALVTGVDFSSPAIDAARDLARELDLAANARFLCADVYDLRAHLPEPASFDRIFVSWGALCWLPDLRAWARVVAHFLRPGGYLALADAHPAAYVFDDANATPDGMPGWYAPYLGRAPLHENDPRDYADPGARLVNASTVQFLHPMADLLTALIDAGLRIDRFQEHDSIVWRMFAALTGDDRIGFRWPERPWLPLSFSVRAARP